MAKKDNEAQLEAAKQKLSNQKLKIRRAESYVRQLNNQKGSLRYVLIDHSHIKSSYELAGVPYANMAETEEGYVQKAGKAFQSKCQEMAEKINAKLKGMYDVKASLEAEVARLSAE